MTDLINLSILGNPFNWITLTIFMIFAGVLLSLTDPQHPFNK